MSRTLAIVITLISAVTLVSSCKIKKTPSKEELAASSNKFNPAQMVEDIWSTKLIPHFKDKAGEFSDVRSAEIVDPNLAGEKFGHKQKAGNAPWTYLVHMEAIIISANTESRASTIDIDNDNDGVADASIQIGPAIRGTALRDSLDFISFNDFTNQIEYAQFGKAFNNYAKKSFLNDLPRDALVGQTVRLLGSYQHKNSSSLPLITPAELSISAAQ
ncbi:MAG: DUF2291 family protein [Granulosicoccus sp.]